jgi:hypothetical protein
MKTTIIVIVILLTSSIVFGQIDQKQIDQKRDSITQVMLQKKKSEIQKNEKETQRKIDSIRYAANSYAISKEMKEKRNSDSLLAIRSKNLLEEQIADYDIKKESLEDSIIDIISFLTREIPKKYNDIGAESKDIKNLMEMATNNIENNPVVIQTTATTYPYSTEFQLKLSAGKEAELNYFVAEREKRKKGYLQTKKKYEDLQKMKSSEITAFEKFKTEYLALVPITQQDQVNDQKENLKKFKTVTDNLMALKASFEQEGILKEYSSGSNRTKVRNIFIEQNWDLSTIPKYGQTNEEMIEFAIQEAKSFIK